MWFFLIPKLVDADSLYFVHMSFLSSSKEYSKHKEFFGGKF